MVAALKTKAGVKTIIGQYGARLACHILGLVWPGNINSLMVGEKKVIIDGWSDELLAEIKTGSSAFKILVSQLETYQRISRMGTEIIYVFLSLRQPPKESLSALTREQVEDMVAESLCRILVVDVSVVAALRKEISKTTTYGNSRNRVQEMLLINQGPSGIGRFFIQPPQQALFRLGLNIARYQCLKGEVKGFELFGHSHDFQIAQVIKKGAEPFPRKRKPVDSPLPQFLVRASGQLGWLLPK